MTNFRPATLGNEGAQVGVKGIKWKGGAGDHAERRGGVIGHRAEATHLFRRMGIASVKMLSLKCGRAASRTPGGLPILVPGHRRPVKTKLAHAQIPCPCASLVFALALGRAPAVGSAPSKTSRGHEAWSPHTPLPIN